MTLDMFNPSFDDLMNDKRLLWQGGDVWKVNQDGVPHQHISREGNLLTVKVPDNVPMRYRGKKLRRLTIWCNACDLVTGLEARYTGGRTLTFRNPASAIYEDLGNLY